MNYRIKIWVIAITVCLHVATIPAVSQTWTSLTGPQIVKNVKDIAVDNSGNTLYIAENDRLLKSTNGSTSWFGVASEITVPLAVIVKPDATGYVTVAGTNFLNKSPDGGANWTPSEAPLITNLTPLRFSASPITPSKMYFGRNYDASTKSVWRSTDGGQGWTECLNFTFQTDVYDVATYPVHDNGAPERDDDVWVVGSGNFERGLWRSTNGGTNWDAAQLPTYNLRSVAILHKPSDDDPYIYVVHSNGAAQRSTDNGGTWSTVSFGNIVRQVRINSFNNDLFFTTNLGVYRSTDEGTSWFSINSGLGSDIDIQSIAITPSSNIMYVGTPNSVYKSTNNGDTWQNVGIMNATSVVGTGSSVWSVSKDNSFAPKHDGTSWTNYFVSSSGNPFSSQQIYRNPNTTHIFVSGAQNNNANLYRSTDGGTTYSSVYAPATGTSKFNGTVVHPTSSTIMYLFGGGTVSGAWKNLFSSTNSGATWQPFSVTVGSGNVYVNDLTVLNASGVIHFYAALSNGEVFRSIDGGTVWSSVLNMGSGSSAASVTSVRVGSDDHIYAGGSTGVWKSTNSGTNWYIKRGDNTKKVILSPGYSATSLNFLALTADGNKIFSSTDGGSTWSEVQGNLPKPINDIKGIPENPPVIYAGTVSGVHKLIGLATSSYPALSSPVNGSEVGAIPTLTWGSVSGASSYHLQISTSSNFSSVTIDVPHINGTSFVATTLTTNPYNTDPPDPSPGEPYTELPSNPITYYWRVAANNFVGETAFSPYWDFDAIRYPFINLSISTVVINNVKHPRLTWSHDDQGTTFYIYRYSCEYGDGDCRSLGGWPYPFIASTTSTTYDDLNVVVANKTETPNVTYYYEVRSRGSSNKGTVNSIEYSKENITELDLPRKTKLMDNYPNPFNPSTTIKYDLAVPGHVLLKVYDMLGREVATLVDEPQEAGYRTVEFDASMLSSGMYFYRLNAGKYAAIKKMMLLK